MKNIREKIKTSYSISFEQYFELEEAAKLYGLSVEKLIRIVMTKYIRKKHKNVISDGNVISYNKHSKTGFKRLYMRLSAKEYSIILQLRFNFRYSTSFLLTLAIKKYLPEIVMALQRKRKKPDQTYFQNLLLNLSRCYIFWPNIDVEENILPFTIMNLNYLYY